MPVNPALTTTVAAGKPLFRITSQGFRTRRIDFKKVVNGQGGVKSNIGARYNYPGAVTVYMTEDVQTCLAEKMFYFHRDILRLLDTSIIPPPFHQEFVLWEITLKKDVSEVFDLSIANAHSYFQIFPSLIVNPSQDYHHLKQKRADIEHQGYRGLRAPSSREPMRGNLIVLFEDQSRNLQKITPHSVEFRLITSYGVPFVNHTHDILDFTAGEVRMPSSQPVGGMAYGNWQKVTFHH
jgi:hypothetical protein